MLIRKAVKWNGTYEEVGSKPIFKDNKEKPSLMSKVLEDVKNGKTVTEIIEQYPSLAFKIKQINELRQKYLAKEYLGKVRPLRVVYLYRCKSVQVRQEEY